MLWVRENVHQKLFQDSVEAFFFFFIEINLK